MGLVGVAVLVKPDLQRLAEPCQRAVKRIGAGFFKERAAKAAVAGRFLAAVPPLDEDVVDLCQCVFQAAFALAQPFFGVVEGAFGKDGTVHAPGAVRKIMCLIEQKQIVPRCVKKAFQVHDGVKQVVVVSDDYITPQA